MKRVTDKAEISLEFPDKLYMGSFGREAGFEVQADQEEVLLKLLRPGKERREFTLHLHYFLLADILAEMATALRKEPLQDAIHREPLQAAAKALADALKRKGRGGKTAKPS